MKARRFPVLVKNGSVIVRVYRVSRPATPTHGAREVFTLAWSAGGKRQTAQFANLKEALSEAALKADQMNAGRIEGAEMTRGERDEMQAAKKLCGGVPLLAALEEWGKVRALTQNNPLAAAEAWAARNSTALAQISVSSAITEFIKAKRAAGVDVSASYERMLPAVSEEFGVRLIHTLKARELQLWMEKRYPHPVSRNTARKRMVSLWRWARKHGHLPRDAQTEIEQTESAREEHTAIGVISAVTFEKLLIFFREKHPEYLGPLVLAGFCGLRRSEIHAQIWSDVELKRSFIRVTKAKRNTPARRIVPLCPAAVEWLMLCANRTDDVCANLSLDRIREIARAAKFVVPENCFRHSFISHRVAQQENVSAVALESGNSPKIIFSNYRELFTKEEGEAWFNIRPGIRPANTGGTVVAYA